MAATLSGLVLTGAFLSLSVVLQAYKSQAGKSSTADSARLILDRMRRDLEATYFSPHKNMTRFVGVDSENTAMQQDKLMFIGCVNNPVETGEGTSDLAEIQYFNNSEDEAQSNNPWLMRRYDPTPDMDPFHGGDIALLGPNVIYLDFQYYDGEMWWPEWDSSESIPKAVYITIGLFNPEQLDQEPTEDLLVKYSTMVWLANYRYVESQGQPGSTMGTEAESQGSGGRSGGGNSSNNSSNSNSEGSSSGRSNSNRGGNSSRGR